MSGTGAPRAAFFTGGLLSASMGGFHFALPDIFHWRDSLGAVPDSIAWALIGLNMFWSALVLATGLLVMLIAVRGWWTQPGARWALVAIGLYWAFHAVYLVLAPFPLPPSLAWLGASFLGFAALQSALHLSVVLTPTSKAAA